MTRKPIPKKNLLMLARTLGITPRAHGTMSSLSTLAGKEAYPKTLPHPKKVPCMRSERLIPLTKPRSVSRSQDDFYAHIRESDLERDYAYDIDSLILQADQCDEHQIPARAYAFQCDQEALSWAFALIKESPLGLAHIRFAQDKGWRFCLSDLGTGGFHLDAGEKVVELDHYGLESASLGHSTFFCNAFIGVIAKALRDIWHEEHWGAFESAYKPEAVLMLERARAADADSLSVLIAWELRGNGYNALWRHILGSEEGDMAQVLTNILERYPTALYNGMALAHVFRQWYADNARVDALDSSSLEHMDYALRDEAIEFGDKNAGAQDFERLSALPGGIIYLKELGETVSRDPFFNGLNDPINQAHLFQIVYDTKVTYVDGIPFRDQALARKFFRAD